MLGKKVSRGRRAGLYLAAALAVGPLAGAASAGDYAWQGDVNADWWGAARDVHNNILATNWDPMFWPGNGDNALIAKAGTVNYWSSVSLNALTISDANAVLYVQGGRDYVNGSLSADTLTNYGTIHLQNSYSNYASSLTAGAGGFTNYGVLNSNLGTGGPRYITGSVFNTALAAININIGTSFSGTTTNHGVYNVVADIVSSYGAGSTFNQNGGSVSIGGNGALRLDQSTFNYAGGTVSGLVQLLNSTLSTSTTDGQGAIFHTYVNSRLSGNLAPNTTVNVSGGGWYNNAILFVEDGAASSGTINLANVYSNYGTHLYVKDDGSGTFTNHGTINSNPGTGGPREFRGNIVSDGVININANTGFYGNITNTGAFTIAAGLAPGMAKGYTFNQNAGTLGVGDGSYLVIDQSTFRYAGGTASGFIRLFNSTLATPTANGNGAVFNTYASSALSGNLAPNTTVVVSGGGWSTNANLTTDSVASSRGTITLQNEYGNYGSYLTIGADGKGTLTNHGTINSNPGTGGPRAITGNVINAASASININWPTVFYGSVNNSGSFAIAKDVNAIFPAGSSFTQTAGSVSIGENAFLRIDQGAFNLAGGTVAGYVEIFNSTLSTSTPNGAGAAFYAYANARLAGNLAENTTVMVAGGGFNTPATLTVDDQASSAGTITLQNTYSNYGSYLTVTDGTGTFTNHGTINSNLGTGGPRAITGNVINAGSVNVNHHTTFNGSIANRGAFNIAAGQEAYVAPNGVFSQNAGALTVTDTGQLSVNGATFNYNGGSASGFLRLLNSTLSTTVGDGQGAVLNTYGSSHLAGNLSKGVTAWVSGGGWISSPAYLNVDDQAASSGTITLESVYGNYGSFLTIADGKGTFTNLGAINSNPGSGGPRAITGKLVNAAAGTININQPTNFYGTVSNSGAFSVAKDFIATLPPAGSTFNQYAGTISVGENAYLRIDQGTLNYNGGLITGMVQLVNSTLSTSTSDGKDAVLNLYVGNHLVGNLAPKTTLLVCGGGWSNNAVLTTDQVAGSAGTITLENVYSNYGTYLNIGDGSGTFTNTGTINSNSGTGGPRQITGNLVNSGSININQPTTLDGSFSNSGTFTVGEGESAYFAPGHTFTQSGGVLTVSASSSLTLDGATFEFVGGAMIGPVTLVNSSLKTTTPDGHGGTFYLEASNTFQTDLAPGSTAWIRGGAHYTSAHAYTPQSVTSAGTITLENVYSNYGTYLHIGDNTGTLLNKGIINSNPGTGGERSIYGHVINDGDINIRTNTSITGNLTNNAALNLIGGTLYSPVINNSGTMYIHPGGGFSTPVFNNTGTLSYAGSHSWAPGSVLNVTAGIVDLQSDTGSVDAYNVTVNVAAGGTVHFGSTQHLAALNLDTGIATLQPGSSSVLVTKRLKVNAPGSLDLCDNDMIVRADPGTRGQVLQEVMALIRSGRNDGAKPWTGPGIVSCIAAADPRHMTALGIALNDKGGSEGPLAGTFAGENVDTNCILVKYTWNGDANIDGVVNADDYFLADSGFLTQKGGWYNGDFNYDSVVNADDYFLIDSAFLGQTGPLSMSVAASAMAVPEPAGMCLFGLGAVLLRRRRRRD